jgi:hypothetical protein
MAANFVVRAIFVNANFYVANRTVRLAIRTVGAEEFGGSSGVPGRVS